MQRPEEHLRADLSQWVVQALSRLFSTYAIVIGIFVITGGRERWSSPAFETAMQVPGAPASWGVAILIIGSVGLFGSLTARLRMVSGAMMGISIWCTFFTLSLLHAALKHPEAATTGVLTYGTMAVTAAVIGSIYKASRT